MKVPHLPSWKTFCAMSSLADVASIMSTSVKGAQPQSPVSKALPPSPGAACTFAACLN